MRLCSIVDLGVAFGKRGCVIFSIRAGVLWGLWWARVSLEWDTTRKHKSGHLANARTTTECGNVHTPHSLVTHEPVATANTRNNLQQYTCACTHPHPHTDPDGGDGNSKPTEDEALPTIGSLIQKRQTLTGQLLLLLGDAVFDEVSAVIESGEESATEAAKEILTDELGSEEKVYKALGMLQELAFLNLYMDD